MPRPSAAKAARARIAAAEQLLSEEWDARQQVRDLEPHTRRSFAADRVKKYADLEPPPLPVELHDRVQGALVYWGVMAETPSSHVDYAAQPRPGRFEVRGVDRESGFDTRLVIAGESEDDARTKADARGVNVASVRRV